MSVIAEQAYKQYSRSNKDWSPTANEGFTWSEIKNNQPSVTQQSRKVHIISTKLAPIQKDIVWLLTGWASEWEQSVQLVSNWGQQKDIGRQFTDLASEWKQSVQVVSDWSLVIIHPSYQRIIGLGPDVIPYILKDLEQNGGHWFWALQSLTGENPVQDEDAGRVRKMTKAWLDWGRQKGYI